MAHAGPKPREATGDRDCRRSSPRPSALSMVTYPGPATEALGSFLADDIRNQLSLVASCRDHPVRRATRAQMHRQQRRPVPRRRAHHARHPGHDIFKGHALFTASTPADSSTSSSPAGARSTTCAASSEGTGATATLTPPATRSHCRAAAPTPRSRPLTSSGQSCSCSIARRPSAELDGARNAGRSSTPLPILVRGPETTTFARMRRYCGLDLIGQLGIRTSEEGRRALSEFEEIGLNGHSARINRLPGRQISAGLLDTGYPFIFRTASDT